MQETIVFGGGGFWPNKGVFELLKGVASVEPWYAGSPKVEVLKIEYDPDTVAFEELLQVFFKSHNPDFIFCTTEMQMKRAQHYIKVLKLPAKIDMLEGKFKNLIKP